MNSITDRETRATAGHFEWQDDQFRSDPAWDEPEFANWRNPPYNVRVCLVAAVWAMPGALAGLMLNLPLHLTADAAIAAAAGAVFFAVVGGRMEAAG